MPADPYAPTEAIPMPNAAAAAELAEIKADVKALRDEVAEARGGLRAVLWLGSIMVALVAGALVWAVSVRHDDSRTLYELNANVASISRQLDKNTVRIERLEAAERFRD